MRVRNWNRFQHYQNRNPPWIKLHRILLDNLEFARLSDKSKAILIQIWLLASESDDGTVTCDINTLKFRLRRSDVDQKDLTPLFDNGFLECASIELSSCIRLSKCTSYLSLPLGVVPGGGDGGKRRPKSSLNGYPVEFLDFWKNYPRKKGKGAALKAMTKIPGWKQLVPEMIKAMTWQSKTEQWAKDNGQFIPHPSTWLNQRRWEDEPDQLLTQPSKRESPRN